MMMKKKLVGSLLACVIGVSAMAAGEYKYQALYWQVDASNVSPYQGAAYASLYAVVSDTADPIGGEGFEIDVASAGTMSVLVGKDKSPVWEWGSYDLSGASFFVELLNDNLDPLGRSYYASYASLGSFMDRNDTGSGDPSTTAQTYTFYFAIPEPTSAMLMLLGVAGLALKRKRRS